MAKTVQSYKLPGDPQQLVSHLRDHLANYAQYFTVEERTPSLLVLRIRHVVAKHWEFPKPGFRVRVLPAGTGSRIILQRTLAPIAGWFFGLWIALSGLALAWAVALMIAKPEDWRQQGYLFWGTVGLTLAGLLFREIYYLVERGRDRELTGILEKAIADFGRPTAIRRREQSRIPGPGPA